MHTIRLSRFPQNGLLTCMCTFSIAISAVQLFLDNYILAAISYYDNHHTYKDGIHNKTEINMF